MADKKISQLTAYNTPLDADILAVVDIANNTTKKVSWLNVKAVLKTYFDTIYTTAGAVSTALTAALASYATLASPTFTGDPKAPTAAATDDDTTLANTAWSRGLMKRGYLYENAYTFFTDFMNAPIAGAGLDIFPTASGGALGSGPSSNANRPGVAVLTTLTAATNRVYLGTATNAFQFGGGTWVYETAVNMSQLSTAGDRYSAMVGFFDTFASHVQVDAIGFLYDEGGVTTGSAASANWQCLTANNSTRTYVTTSVAVNATANVYTKLRIEVNAAASSVTFYINGTLVATITTNIPTGAGREAGFGLSIIKTIGTTACILRADYLYVQNLFTSAR